MKLAGWCLTVRFNMSASLTSHFLGRLYLSVADALKAPGQVEGPSRLPESTTHTHTPFKLKPKFEV